MSLMRCFRVRSSLVLGKQAYAGVHFFSLLYTAIMFVCPLAQAIDSWPKMLFVQQQARSPDSGGQPLLYSACQRHSSCEAQARIIVYLDPWAWPWDPSSIGYHYRGFCFLLLGDPLRHYPVAV